MKTHERGSLVPGAFLLIISIGVGLSVMGIVGIYAGEKESAIGPMQTLRQIAGLAMGLIALTVVYSLGFQRIGRWSYVLYAVTMILLVLLVLARKVPLAPLIVPKRNAFRWIQLGPVGLQVSEIGKLAAVLAIARYLRFRESHRRILGLLAPLLLTGVPMLLILAEPDLGTALVFLPTTLAMLYAAGARSRHLGLLVGLAGLAAPLFYFSPLMSSYQRARIAAVLRQADESRAWQMSAGYQLRQSKIAIGSGGALGQGLGEGSFFRHGLLPESHNDFIFAVVAYQWGFLGGALILFGYLVMIGAILVTASATPDPFGRLLAVGLASLLATQTIINVGMTLGLLPITGLTMPFVSFGSSALVASYTMLGLAASVARRKPPSLAPELFEFSVRRTA